MVAVDFREAGREATMGAKPWEAEGEVAMELPASCTPRSGPGGGGGGRTMLKTFPAGHHYKPLCILEQDTGVNA
jgi:hypothetical protein